MLGLLRLGGKAIWLVGMDIMRSLRKLRTHCPHIMIDAHRMWIILDIMPGLHELNWTRTSYLHFAIIHHCERRQLGKTFRHDPNHSTENSCESKNSRKKLSCHPQLNLRPSHLGYPCHVLCTQGRKSNLFISHNRLFHSKRVSFLPKVLNIVELRVEEDLIDKLVSRP